VCVVSDGRNKIHPRTLSLLATLGVYQDGVAKNVVNGKPVTAHIYEVSLVKSQLRLDSVELMGFIIIVHHAIVCGS
jgi:hypothetical protein